MEDTTDRQPDPLSPDGLSGARRLYGVIGWPLGHSMSPAIHTAAFEALGLPYVYRMFPVPAEAAAFEAFLARCANAPVPVGGCSVTIPHKENALAWLKQTGGQVDPLAARIGAVNTLAFSDAGAFGSNTDCQAAVAAIASAVGGQAALAGKAALVLGAGGAGRAVVFGLIDAGCRVSLADVDAGRAAALAADSGATHVPMDAVGRIETDILANASPVGMHPNVAASPVPAAALREGMVVFDVVYNPLRTRLLREAEAAGCRTVAGIEMFVGQAVAQCQLWTGRPAPRDVMRRVVLERLRHG
jgi:shikimate dehydrogenase